MFSIRTAAIAGVCLFAGSALAQNYPTRPITMIVPFAAGGPTDIIARIVAEPMSKALGQQIVVENVTGAGGTTGITRGARATADGYTIMMGHMGTHGAAPALYANLRYNPAKDFQPIGMAAGTPIIVVARKNLPAKDLKEFIAWVAKTGDKVNQAHAGVGSVSYTTGVLLTSMIPGANPALVPYKGTGPSLNDLVAGQVDFMTDQIVNVVSQIRAGSIRAYAIATKTRSPALPDLPTTAEMGLPNYEVSAWNAVFAPKGLPKDITDKLVAALNKALDDPNARKRFDELGGVVPGPDGRGPAALQKQVEFEVARWNPVLKAALAKAKK
ncbi:MAG: tripartite tricarboxylate transporter substrate-binding protein [Beijerinckiaceae bacterium]